MSHVLRGIRAVVLDANGTLFDVATEQRNADDMGDPIRLDEPRFLSILIAFFAELRHRFT